MRYLFGIDLKPESFSERRVYNKTQQQYQLKYAKTDCFAYRIVSLGCDCMSRTIPTLWGIKPRKKQGEISYPFDLSNNQLQGIVKNLREDFAKMQYFMNGYRTRQYHYETGLYFWINDVMIGVDNDPSTFYRPDRSSASIYLNCIMYKELLAMSYLAECLDLGEIKDDYDKWAEDLKAAVQEHCWDEKDGMFYSVDLNLKPRINDHPAFHQGAQRHWDCLIQRIGCWSSFMALWAGIATPEQARRIVDENLLDERTFNAPYGVRTLSKLEKMYNVKASGNPSSWLGPIWGVSNYMTWKGLVNYGMDKEAKELAAKTVVLFGRDFERNGALHEYYLPENGEPVLNKGFQNWNFLVLNMLAWLEGRHVVSEF